MPSNATFIHLFYAKAIILAGEKRHQEKKLDSRYLDDPFWNAKIKIYKDKYDLYNNIHHIFLIIFSTVVILSPITLIISLSLNLGFILYIITIVIAIIGLIASPKILKIIILNNP